MHALHGGQDPPPQSTSVSEPSLTWFMQLAPPPLELEPPPEPELLELELVELLELEPVELLELELLVVELLELALVVPQGLHWTVCPQLLITGPHLLLQVTDGSSGVQTHWFWTQTDGGAHPPQSTDWPQLFVTAPHFDAQVITCDCGVQQAPPAQTPPVQSEPWLHVLPSGQWGHDPPQSRSVSMPFFTPSVHLGAWQMAPMQTPL